MIHPNVRKGKINDFETDRTIFFEKPPRRLQSLVKKDENFLTEKQPGFDNKSVADILNFIYVL